MNSEPSNEISDRYAAVVIETTDGQLLTGHVITFDVETLALNTNMLDRKATVQCDRAEIDHVDMYDLSMMPSGLLDTLNKGEILDLKDFLLSRGNQDAMFRKQHAAATRN